MSTVDIVVPDIGTEDEVDVIEVLVKPGDHVNLDDALITLESDKATMDVPAPQAGTVQTVSVAAGDKVREGHVILSLVATDDSLPANAGLTTPPDVAAADSTTTSPAAGTAAAATGETADTVDIYVPDVGSDDAVDVIEVLVAVGDSIAIDDPVITLESDKASMDVPATASGTVETLYVSVGDKLTTGARILSLSGTTGTGPTPAAETATSPPPPPATAGNVHQDPASPANLAPTPAAVKPPPPIQLDDAPQRDPASIPHASPSVRRFARELGADLRRITGTGRKNRILREDVQAWVKAQLSGATGVQTGTAGSQGHGIPSIPAVDFSKFGDVERVPLTRIKRISGPFLQRSWLNVPHVTHHDEADVTEMEAFRQSLKAEARERGISITPLVFAMRALVSTLREFPQFNASLSPDGENLILKKYFHIGIAVDTPDGLVVPVVRDVDKKGLFDLAEELGDISKRAREGKLKSTELQGGSMSISSLGGIGGTAFTPIVNAPEVAILGMARSRMTPVWDGSEFKPRLMQPLDVSYDHRAVDGAEAARFTVYLRDTLSDIRRLVL